MKNQLLLLFAATFLASASAQAQTKDDATPALPPKFFVPQPGDYYVIPIPNARPGSGNDLQIAPLFRSTRTPTLMIGTVEVGGKKVYEAQIVLQKVGDVLETIAAQAGVPIVVDPKLKDKLIVADTLRAPTLRGLLEQVAQGRAEILKSALGTLFFADVPTPAVPFSRRVPILPLPQNRSIDPGIMPGFSFGQGLPQNRSIDPSIMPRLELDPGFVIPSSGGFRIPNSNLPDTAPVPMPNPYLGPFPAPAR